MCTMRGLMDHLYRHSSRLPCSTVPCPVFPSPGHCLALYSPQLMLSRSLLPSNNICLSSYMLDSMCALGLWHWRLNHWQLRWGCEEADWEQPPARWGASILERKRAPGKQDVGLPVSSRPHPETTSPSGTISPSDVERAGRQGTLLSFFHQWQNWGLLRWCDLSKGTLTQGCFCSTVTNFKWWRWGVCRKPLCYLCSSSVNLILFHNKRVLSSFDPSHHLLKYTNKIN